MAIEIDDVDELPPAVLRCLEKPEEKSKKRLVYKERVFGNLIDGKSAERIANRIKLLLNPKQTEKEYVDAMWNAFNSQYTRKLRTRLVEIEQENQLLKKKIMNYEKAYSIRLAKIVGRIPGVTNLIESIEHSKKYQNDE